VFVLWTLHALWILRAHGMSTSALQEVYTEYIGK